MCGSATRPLNAGAGEIPAHDDAHAAWLADRLRDLRAAVEAIVREPHRFGGVVLDVRAVLDERESIPGDPSDEVERPSPASAPESVEQLRQEVRAALEAHPDFQSRPRRGRAVAWIVDRPFSNPDVGDQEGPDVDDFICREEVQRREHVERLCAAFPRPWRVYCGYTRDTCANWQRAIAAALKGYAPRDVAYWDCPRQREFEQELGLRAAADGDGADASAGPAKPKVTGHPCQAAKERQGRHGYRVMPSYLLRPGRGKARREPPQNADVIVLETWPKQERRWKPEQLRKMAKATTGTPTCGPVAKMLEALAGLAERGERLLGADLYDRLSPPWSETIWMELEGGRAARLWAAREPDGLRKVPANPERLLSAIREDVRTWQQARNEGHEAKFSSWLRIAGPVGDCSVFTKDPQGPIPDVFTRAAVIDLTGWARHDRRVLEQRGIQVLTPAAVLARVAPQLGKRQQKYAAKLQALLRACEVLDLGSVPKTKTTLARLTREAGVNNWDLSRGTLARELAERYGGDWVPGPDNTLMLVKRSE